MRGPAGPSKKYAYFTVLGTARSAQVQMAMIPLTHNTLVTNEAPAELAYAIMMTMAHGVKVGHALPCQHSSTGL